MELDVDVTGLENEGCGSGLWDVAEHEWSRKTAQQRVQVAGHREKGRKREREQPDERKKQH